MTSGVGRPPAVNSPEWFAWKIKELEEEIRDLKAILKKNGIS